MRKFPSSDTLPKLRLILSSISTFNYDLSHFLCGIFSLVVPDDYSYKNNFSFHSQIMNASLSGEFPVSYDVTRLFANIPLQETIERAINLICNHNPNLNKHH